jgi:hypothetical protein
MVEVSGISFGDRNIQGVSSIGLTNSGGFSTNSGHITFEASSGGAENNIYYKIKGANAIHQWEGSNGKTLARLNDSGAFTLGGTLASSPSLQLSQDGTASFSGGDVSIDKGAAGEGSGITVTNTAGGDYAYRVVSGGGNQTVTINSNGEATFKGSVTSGANTGSVTQDTAGVGLNSNTFISYIPSAASSSDFCFRALKTSAAGGGNVFTVTNEGIVTAPNTFLALDTGETLDVKARLQNTQAGLLRLKAALLIPDQDVNQLRARLLEALENITEEEN